MDAVARLVINEYGKDCREYILGDIPVRVGRDPLAEIVLADVAVSREHIVIRREGRGYVLEDLGSQNGTLLDGAPLPCRGTCRLAPGATIRVGRSELRFLHSVPSRTTSRAPPDADGEKTAQSGDTSVGPGRQSLFDLAGITARLVVVERGLAPTRHTLRSDRVALGRDAQCDIAFSEPSVSKRHAEIVYNAEGFHLVDLDSTFGTTVDGTSVRVARLEHRSCLAFGKAQALFVLEAVDEDRSDFPFALRDHFVELLPDKEKTIADVFQRCREKGLDFAEELIARGVLEPREWWGAMQQWGSAKKRHTRGWKFFRR